MKKGIFLIFYLFGLIPFFFFVYAATPAFAVLECTVLTYSYYLTTPGQTTGYETWTFDGTNAALGDANTEIQYPIYYWQVYKHMKNDGVWSGVFQLRNYILNVGPGTYVPKAIQHISSQLDAQGYLNCPVDPCEEAEKDPVSDCGSIEGVIWENVDTCEYHCEDCDENFQMAEATCGESNFSLDDSTCFWACDDCSDAEDNADTLCEHGWNWTNIDNCSYECVDRCAEAFNWCVKGCQDLGGIYKQACEEDAQGNIVGVPLCECRDSEPNDPDPGVDPDEPVDPPDDDPADDPTEDPADNDQQVGNKWLAAIKSNTDTLVEQGNVDADEQAKHTSSLDAIAENTKTIANNQGNVVDAIEGLGDKLDTKPLDLTKVESKLDALIDNTGTPDGFDPEFDLGEDVSTLQEMKDSVVGSFTDYEGVTVDDVSWFGTLYTSIVPPTGTCVPLDLSVRGHELIIGCQYDSEVKAVMAYFMSILSIITIFQLVRKELIPKTSSG